MAMTLLLGSFVLATAAYGSLSLEKPGTSQQPIEQVRPATQVTVRVLPAPWSEKDPFARVLRLREAALRHLYHSSTRTPNPRIICGMKVWRVDPNVDPGIHEQLPVTAFDAKIQRIAPKTCRE